MRKLRGQDLSPIVADALREVAKGLKEILGKEEIEFPSIEDYTEEGLERRRLRALWKIIKRKRKLGPEELLKIFTLKKEGKSSREIAKELGCSHTAVNRGYDRTRTVFREEGLLE
jgi:DNA-directed RNA polymerase specialized sigma24 family protein